MSRRLWIVWLMLALLPLRGWAVATMAFPSAAPVVVEQTSSEHAKAAASHAVQAPIPCHPSTLDGDDQRSGGPACTLCDLCHNAVATHDLPLLASPLRVDTAPRPLVAHDTGHPTVGGLERPPRPFPV